MSANYVPPGGGTSYPIFRTGTHTDQLGINDSPDNAVGYKHSTTLNASANLYLSQSSTNVNGLNIYNHQLQTNRNYAGGDTVRSHRIACLVQTDVDNNDPSIPNVVDIYGWNFASIINAGRNGPNYGSSLCYSGFVDITTESNGNEYSLYHGVINAGSYDNHVAAGGNYWTTDLSLYGPIAAQPGEMYGYSMQIVNGYNGSPSRGASVGCRIMSIMDGPGLSSKYHQGGVTSGTRATIYPIDIGVGVSGATDGGTGDAFTNAIQIGGDDITTTGVATMAGDQGQVGRGVYVRAKNAGTSCARLGAFVSAGTGEAGGLVLGLDTNDANRASISRPSAGVMTLRGKVSYANGGYAASTTATPANVAGRIAIYNDAGTLLGYLPIYGSL